jgi:hypothetical protein
LDVAATLVEGRIEAVLLPEFADEDLSVFYRLPTEWYTQGGKFR